MKPLHKTLLGVAFATGFAALLAFLLRNSTFDVLMPAGIIGAAERDLMIHAIELMLIVAIPVFILAIFIAWHYRAGNESATYKPNWEHSKMEELIWWSIPLEIVLVLAALTWTSTHELDPGRPLAMNADPLVVQAIALEWKWLFIYPEEGIASLNEVTIPVNRPIEFRITADAPMNSLWIPALGGQLYAMTGMTTVLHLAADTPGNYQGSSSNYSGEGFAQMKFVTRALDETSFTTWVEETKKKPGTLDAHEYALLKRPGLSGPVSYYGAVSDNFFGEIVHSFMATSMPEHHHMGM